MKKKNTKRPADKKAQRVVLGAAIVAALGALAIMVIVLPIHNPGAKNGVGADGFSVFEVKGADLGVDKVVDKQTVANALGKKAKSVDNVDNSGVISLNGSKGQTATYNFTLENGNKGRIDVDILVYKDKSTYESDGVFNGTGDAGKVNGMQVRYLPAITLGPDREYALLVTKDLKSYKFSMSQLNGKTTIREIEAQSILKELISKANL